jgi:hypothetical protein
MMSFPSSINNLPVERSEDRRPYGLFGRERLHVIQWLGMSMLLAGGGADACVEDMLHPTHWNKPTRFYVSSREKKRWHPSLLKHKELLF